MHALLSNEARRNASWWGANKSEEPDGCLWVSSSMADGGGNDSLADTALCACVSQLGGGGMVGGISAEVGFSGDIKAG